MDSVARMCPDCLDQRIFVPIDDCEGDACEFCCTSCGAAVSIDPVFDYTGVITTLVA